MLDVPAEAESMHFGFYLRGSGKAWAAGFDLREAASDQVATGRKRLHPGPVNLDFSQRDRPSYDSETDAPKGR